MNLLCLNTWTREEFKENYLNVMTERDDARAQKSKLEALVIDLTRKLEEADSELEKLRIKELNK